MKLTKSQLKKLIKEELLKEQVYEALQLILMKFSCLVQNRTGKPLEQRHKTKLNLILQEAATKGFKPEPVANYKPGCEFGAAFKNSARELKDNFNDQWKAIMQLLIRAGITVKQNRRAPRGASIPVVGGRE